MNLLQLKMTYKEASMILHAVDQYTNYVRKQGWEDRADRLDRIHDSFLLALIDGELIFTGDENDSPRTD